MDIQLWNLQNKIPVHAQEIKRSVRKILAGERINKAGWINICFVDDRQIKKYNARFLNHKNATDVLAFNLTSRDERGIILADIMVSAQTAIRQARTYKTTPEHELSLYVAHGILHILGYNDKTARQRKLMRKKENQYVNR